jgi:hypothetical protein
MKSVQRSDVWASRVNTRYMRMDESNVSLFLINLLDSLAPNGLCFSGYECNAGQAKTPTHTTRSQEPDNINDKNVDFFLATQD